MRDYLLDAYGGFADKSCTDPSQDRDIKIDDLCDQDVSPVFCTISARVPRRTEETLMLTLRNAPCNAAIKALVEMADGILLPSENGATVILRITEHHVSVVFRMSNAIRKLATEPRKNASPD
jgi:hypothetical protein